MKIVFSLIAIIITLADLAIGAEAQQTGKAYRIGYVGNACRRWRRAGGVQETRLQDLGCVLKGRTLSIEWRFSKGDRYRILQSGRRDWSSSK